MSKTSNQLAKTAGVSFNKTDAERIAAAVLSVEDGGRVSMGRNANPNFSLPITKLFIIEGLEERSCQLGHFRQRWGSKTQRLSLEIIFLR